MRYHYDAGHSWLKVPIALLRASGVFNDISECSYKRGEFAYLECDCDAQRFIIAMKQSGRPLNIDTTDVDDGNTSPIRSYRRFKQ